LHEDTDDNLPFPGAYERTREFFLRHLVEPASE
jgi:hypothetical protein